MKFEGCKVNEATEKEVNLSTYSLVRIKSNERIQVWIELEICTYVYIYIDNESKGPVYLYKYTGPMF